MFDLLAFLHVLAAVVWVGGALMVGILGFRMPTADPVHRMGFARDVLFLGRRVFTPAIVVALATGVWMVIDADPVYAFEQVWIAAGLGALLTTAGIGTGFILPKTRAAIGMVDAGDGPGAAALLRKVSLAGRFNATLLVATVALMVFKPGL